MYYSHTLSRSMYLSEQSAYSWPKVIRAERNLEGG